MNNDSIRGGPIAAVMFAFMALLTSATANADPCGMVPPVYIQGPVPLARTGLQKTYVFYKDGVETFVIRPGFTGKVEEFGMLIPFPTPPELRKVPDAIFSHIAAAVDPPEVVVDLRPRERDYAFAFGDAVSETASKSEATDELQYREKVRVIKQEAVGMYEVAVLEAGSVEALNRWMTEHGYRYPDGMDKVCTDYIEDNWCFVAIKARVGQKAGADPKPAIRSVNTKLPSGSSFDGHVQGMGFRFKSDELVVPMRLSAFNEGDLHNVVYLLSDNPMRAESISTGSVVRQVPGTDLYRHLTSPLPLRIIGGEYKDIPGPQKQGLKHKRDQTKHNGQAQDLFAGDLSSARTQRLSHDHEELEKQLLQIGERLGLRGADLDQLHAELIQAERKQIANEALTDLKKMTLTILDGDFPRDVIAADNLTFTSFKMNAKKNSAKSYDAIQFGPKVQVSSVSEDAVEEVTIASDGGTIILQDPPSRVGERLVFTLFGLAILSIIVALLRSFREKETSAAGIALLLAFTASSWADDVPTEKENESGTIGQTVARLLDQTSERSGAEGAVDKIIGLGSKAVRPLEQQIRIRGFVQQGWAITCLSEIDDESADRVLAALQQNGSRYGQLVRTWAVAARIARTDSLDDLKPFFSESHPALKRPLSKRLQAHLSNSGPEMSVETILDVASRYPQMQSLVADTILTAGPEPLAAVMVKSADQNVRNMAAAWLATIAQTRQADTAKAVIAALTFDPKSESAPWDGGPLWIPSVAWNQQQARDLVTELTSWYVWCDRNEQTATAQQIVNNFNSVGLQSQAGYRVFSPQTIERWLLVWGEVIGKTRMQQLLRKQGVDTDIRFKSILNQLP